MVLDENKVTQSLEAIAAYENKEINHTQYKDFAVKALGLKEHICDTCGDKMAKLHEDFQKRINNEVLINFPHLAPELELKSGKYSGDFHRTNFLKSTFKGIENIINTMKKDAQGFFKLGLKEQSRLVFEDIEKVKEFVNVKKGLVLEKIQEVEKIADVVTEVIADVKGVLGDVDAENDKKEAEPIDPTPETITKEGTEGTEGTEQVPPTYTDQAAYEMEQSGMKQTEIAAFFQTSTPTISRKLKAYKESMLDKNNN